ncbi:MAG: DUF1826 domain-containing protein [Myxococcaceae bacterium]|nr:DUF1826 domain-containing protein [Myxococcaceae bacterium]
MSMPMPVEPRHRSAHSVLELAEIYAPATSLLWWPRPVEPGVDLFEREPFSWAGEVASELPSTLTEQLTRHEIVEATSLVELHRDLFEVPTVGLRVALLDAPLCPAFHVDKVPCRLIATLSGAGTEWRVGDTVHQLPPGAAGWFKGTQWPGSEPVVHRSPPGHERRLVLTIDLL